MSKCKSILDYFKFNSESEILEGPENHDQSEPSVSGLPVTGVSQGKKPCMFMHVSCMILHCMHDATCRHNNSCMIMHASGMVILNARKESV